MCASLLAAFAPSTGCDSSTAPSNHDSSQIVVWGTYDDTYWVDGHFSTPTGLATGPTGELFVADMGNDRIEVFDANGRFLRKWAAPIDWDIATDAYGNVYAAIFDSTVVKFDSSGHQLASWGQPVEVADDFTPSALAVNTAADRVYVANDYNNVLVFTTNGTYVETWSTNLAGLAVDRDGNVLCVGYSAPWIRKRSPTGTPLMSWGDTGALPGQFKNPEGIASDSDGNIYVCDEGNYRIQKFTTDGTFLAEWGKKGNDPGEFSNAPNVAVGNDGSVYVSDRWGNRRVQKFDSQGNFILKIGQDKPATGSFHFPAFIAVDRFGYVYVLDPADNRVQKFDYAGRFVTAWGDLGKEPGTFDRPMGITLLESSVFVVDNLNSRVQVFDTNGQFVKEWGGDGSMNTQLHYPVDAATTPGGNIAVLDWGNNMLKVFTPSGEYVSGFQLTGERIAIDQNADIYVAGSAQDKIQKFDATGKLLLEWGGSGEGPGSLNRPQGIAIGSNGNIVVADNGNSRVQMFDTKGKFVSTWGSAGGGVGDLDSPVGVACWKDFVFIGDAYNTRIQRVPLSLWHK